MSSIPINCPACGKKIGQKPSNYTSGGQSVVCAKCHIRVNVKYNKDGSYRVESTQKTSKYL